MIKAVAEKDIFNIRSYLIAAIVADKTLKRLEATIEYCVKNGIPESEIYDPHDGKEISNDVTEDNYKDLRADLNSNFSKERLDMLKKVAAKLYPAK